MFHTSDNKYKCIWTRHNQYVSSWDITTQCYWDIINLAPPLYLKICIYNTQWLWPLLSHVYSDKSKREYRLEQCTLWTSSEKLLFVADGHYHRDSHWSRCREQDIAECLALNRTPISYALLPRFRGCYEKGGKKGCRSQRCGWLQWKSVF